MKRYLGFPKTLLFLLSLPFVLPLASSEAQTTSLTLGPEADVGVTYESGAFTQYQTDLRCNPLNPQELSITCKYKGEIDTLLFHTKNGGTTWDHTRQANSGDPDVVYDPMGRAHWSFIDKANGNKTGYKRSLDGGTTWEAKKGISTEGLDHMHITCDRTSGAFAGSLYVAGRAFSGAVVVVLRSRDGGATWQSTRVTMPSAVGKGFVQNILVLKDGSLVIPIKSQIRVLADSNGYYAGSKIDMFVMRSTDGGVSFSAPVRVGDMNGVANSGSPSSRSFATVSGLWGTTERLYLVFSRNRVGQPSILQICTSDDLGQTWTTPRDVVPPTPTGWGQGGCVSAMVNSEGTLGIQYYNFKPGSISEFDLYFTASIDGGATFLTPTRISTATSKDPSNQPREPGGDQVYADVSSDGQFQLVWTDARGGATNYKIYRRPVKVNRGGTAAEVILDNASTSGVVLQGAWTNSTSTGGYYGANYIHDGNTLRGTKSVTFAPTLAGSSNYDVFLRWTSGSNRATNVPVDITYNGGTDAIALNQRTGGGAWILVGTYPFAAGNTGRIRVSNTGTDGYVIVDAVRLKPHL